jgi:hypothetical protein
MDTLSTAIEDEWLNLLFLTMPPSSFPVLHFLACSSNFQQWCNTNYFLTCHFLSLSFAYSFFRREVATGKIKKESK